LALLDREVLRRLEPGFKDVIEILRSGDRPSAKAAYLRLVEVVTSVSLRNLRPPHAAYTTRLALVQERLAHPGRLVSGLTTHQAKDVELFEISLVRGPERHQQGSSNESRGTRRAHSV
jgi:hypothetical protein